MKNKILIVLCALILSACTMPSKNKPIQTQPLPTQTQIEGMVSPTSMPTPVILTGTFDEELEKELKSLEMEMKKLDDGDFAGTELDGLESN